MAKYVDREVETLALTDHVNIVKLIAVETRLDKKLEKVLIMEVCDGTLDDIIGKNSLEYPEFLRLCSHLSSAIKHLREKDLIHRDIKPGNILYSVAVDGQLIYKLADFGSARILKTNDSYISLYGTTEFAHPDIIAKQYAQVLGIKRPPRTFMPNHDLWPIGVTLYCAATGNLPFSPRNGRDDIPKLFEMISKKRTNDISAQELDDGQIVWSSKLPKFKDEVAAFVAGLLNVIKNKILALLSRLFLFFPFFHLCF